MNISVDKLLSRIEAELKLAKACVKEENLREKVYSIKILCELILDEEQMKSESEMPLHKISQQPLSMNQPKKLEMDNETNGDSLLDF